VGRTDYTVSGTAKKGNRRLVWLQEKAERHAGCGFDAEPCEARQSGGLAG
jgi:hypothetical protein